MLALALVRGSVLGERALKWCWTLAHAQRCIELAAAFTVGLGARLLS